MGTVGGEAVNEGDSKNAHLQIKPSDLERGNKGEILKENARDGVDGKKEQNEVVGP
jgi:hypothetical protein